MRTAATGWAMGSATVDIRFFPPNSDFNRALKLALGRLRNSAAMRTSGSMPDSTFGGLPSIAGQHRLHSFVELFNLFLSSPDSCFLDSESA